jgi:prepilin-type N-terminal cleavage/methylation domain-containing protein
MLLKLCSFLRQARTGKASVAWGLSMKRKQAGFSLIELLIVVAIILIIAAIAIPNLMASRMAANESSAVQEARAITTAEVVYHTQYGIGFSAQLTDLGDGGVVSSTSAGLIDSVLAAGTKGGYSFLYVPLNQDSSNHYQNFTLNANPLDPGHSGRKYFYTDQTGVIRVNLTAPALPADPAI